MNYVDYREKLGIGFNDKEKYGFFKSFMLNLMDFPEQSYPPVYSSKEYFSFCLSVGQKFEEKYSGDYIQNVLDLLKNSRDLQSFLSYYVFFVIHYDDGKNREIKKEFFKKILKNGLEVARIPFEPLSENNELFVFPKGAEELDFALITEPLEWMKKYPISRETFCRALKQYSKGEHTRDIADNLRKALEEFLKEYLGNEKDLGRNRVEICDFLKAKGADKNVTNMLEPLLASYKKINDDRVKHNDKLDPKFLEFILYQTGLFIRMIITVGKEE